MCVSGMVPLPPVLRLTKKRTGSDVTPVPPRINTFSSVLPARTTPRLPCQRKQTIAKTPSTAGLWRAAPRKNHNSVLSNNDG